MSRKSLFLLILAVILAIVLYRSGGWQFDWSLFFASLWDLQPGWLAASISATLLSYVVRAFRWQVLLNPLKRIPIPALLSTTIVGFAAIYVLGRAGEVIRPIWLTRREHVALTASFATIIVERVLDSMMLIVLFGWALLVVDVPLEAAATLNLMKNTAWIMIGGSIAGMIFLFFFRSNIDRILRYVPFAGIASLLRSFSQGVSFLEEGRSLMLALVHSLTLWVLIVLQFWFILLGLSFELTITAATLVMVGAARPRVMTPGSNRGADAQARTAPE
jgi:uncharacterized protein (TIRG00374 family)